MDRLYLSACLTKQTRQDNNNMVFNKDVSETNVDNEPNRIKYDGFQH